MENIKGVMTSNSREESMTPNQEAMASSQETMVAVIRVKEGVQAIPIKKALILKLVFW